MHIIDNYNQTTMLIGDRGKIAAPSVNLFYTRITALLLDSIVDGRDCQKVGHYQNFGTKHYS